MIRFSAALVVVAIGVLVGGMATSGLRLVYVAIGLSVVALLTLALGVALKREEIFGDQGQPALAGQGANAGLGQERPQAVAAAERSAAPGKQDVFGEPFGQQAAAFGQATWPAAPDMYSGRPSPSRSDGPQQPAAQTGVDTALVRANLAKTRTDLAETKADLTAAKADLAETKADLTAPKADPAKTKAGTAPERPAAVSWFQRIAPAKPAGDGIKPENADAAGPPTGESAAKGDAPAEDATVADTDADAAADTAVADTAAEDATAADATAEDATVAVEAAEDATAADATVAVEATDTDEAADTDEAVDTKPSAAGPDAEAEAEDSARAEAADSSPDGDQEDRSGQREVTVVPGVPRYHDAHCILIRFMGDDDLQKMTLDEATEAGCTPCRACMPEHA